MRFLDLVPVLAQSFSLSFMTPTKPIAQYCIACIVSELDCSHNRVGRLASMGRKWSGEGVFAQDPLTMLEVRVVQYVTCTNYLVREF